MPQDGLFAFLLAKCFFISGASWNELPELVSLIRDQALKIGCTATQRSNSFRLFFFKKTSDRDVNGWHSFTAKTFNIETLCCRLTAQVLSTFPLPWTIFLKASITLNWIWVKCRRIFKCWPAPVPARLFAHACNLIVQSGWKKSDVIQVTYHWVHWGQAQLAIFESNPRCIVFLLQSELSSDSTHITYTFIRQIFWIWKPR